MSWRTVIVTKRCKLDLKMGFMVVRADEVQRIFLDEIAVLVIESTAVSLTAALVEALLLKKVKIIFCNSKHLPLAEMIPYSASYNSSAHFLSQISWSEERKAIVWTEIIRDKIRNQAEFLHELKHYDEAELLLKYIEQIEPFDPTHREAHAAKVYFNALFGMNFRRSDEIALNAALDYGYSILLAAVSREITIAGYIMQIGLCHHNGFNPFNLACDIMEPMRIAVDRKIYALTFKEFDTEVRHAVATILEMEVSIDGEKNTLLNAIRIYVRGVLDALETGLLTEMKHFCTL